MSVVPLAYYCTSGTATSICCPHLGSSSEGMRKAHRGEGRGQGATPHPAPHSTPLFLLCCPVSPRDLETSAVPPSPEVPPPAPPPPVHAGIPPQRLSQPDTGAGRGGNTSRGFAWEHPPRRWTLSFSALDPPVCSKHIPACSKNRISETKILLVFISPCSKWLPQLLESQAV